MAKKNKKTEVEAVGDSCPLHGPGTGGLDMDGEYTDDLLSSLAPGTPVKKIVIPSLQSLVPQTLFITDRNYQLGQTIGPVTEDIDGRALEVGGFFTIEKDDPLFTYKGFIVPKELPVTQGNITIAEHYDAAAREMKAHQDIYKNERLAAMFHIHPDKNGGLHHSPADNDSLVMLVNRMAKTTRRVFEAPFSLIADNIRTEYGDTNYCLKGDELTDAVQRFYYPDDEAFLQLLKDFGMNPDVKDFRKREFLAKLLDTIGKETYEPRKINFGVSFVFNNGKGKPFVKMGIQETLPLSQKQNYVEVSNIPIEIIEKGINILTEAEVEALVNERVKFPEKYTPTHMAGRFGDVIIQGGERIIRYVMGDDQSDFISIAGTSKVERRIAAAKRAAEKEKKPSEDTSADVLEALQNGSAVKHVQKYTPVSKHGPANKFRTKEDNPAPTIAGISQLFTMALYGYALRYRDKDCKYSTYVIEALDEMSAWNTTGGSNQQWQTHKKKGRTNGFWTAVNELGDLVADDPTLVEEPKLPRYRIDTIVENIYDELVNDQDVPTAQFMNHFVQSTTLAEQNALLEEYIGKLFHPKKYAQNADTSATAESQTALAGSGPENVTNDAPVNSEPPIEPLSVQINRVINSKPEPLNPNDGKPLGYEHTDDMGDPRNW
jgi:hypothetical protein